VCALRMTERERQHLVVVNDEEQYSVWPADTAMPAGWSAVGEARSSRDECLKWIGENWKDIRPLSVRQSLAGKD
jgi:MbtH protein